ncbi:MAG TPA: hypothetical protein VFE33_22480 [Thermoanaerobaculia bacterium]|nr:hypothetical protein [Thermoanaerobaculia bacterium]
MSSHLVAWPAGSGLSLPSTRRFTCERAIWGKAQGASTDFRWLARSAGFDTSSDLERSLTLGAEDRLQKATFWRRHGTRWYGGVYYGSQARDAAGRQGFLEKHLLQWDPGEEFPAALGALALLPAVSTFDDALWWERRGDPGWVYTDFSLALEPLAIEVAPAEIERTLAQGLAALQPFGEAGLTALYVDLLSARRPACLRGVARPLSAAALAALLLPLPRERADTACLAAWLPAQHLERGNLTHWDLLAVAAEGRPASPLDPDVERQAAAWARALVKGDPGALQASLVPVEPSAPKPLPAQASGLRPHRLHLTPLPEGAPEPLRELYEFAAAPRRRWFPPRPLPSLKDPRNGEILFRWIAELTQQAGDADPQQWDVKIDFLRRAAIALVPGKHTEKRVGSMPGSRVLKSHFAAAERR